MEPDGDPSKGQGRNVAIRDAKLSAYSEIRFYESILVRALGTKAILLFGNVCTDLKLDEDVFAHKLKHLQRMIRMLYSGDTTTLYTYAIQEYLGGVYANDSADAIRYIFLRTLFCKEHGINLISIN